MFDPQFIDPFTWQDLDAVLQFVGECTRDPRYAGAHPGDVVHSMSNGLRGRMVEAESCYFLYREAGEIVAVIGFEAPGTLNFQVLSHPERASQTDDLDAALLAWAARSVIARCPEPPKPDDLVKAAADTLDVARNDRLRALGYTLNEPWMAGSMRALGAELPQFPLPEGFTIRGTSEADVENLIAVHSGAFGSLWTVERYLRVMQTPGFDPARELVAVAPDGQFGAFIVIWCDPVSQIGLFEPVGTHTAFQRRGLGKALMAEGLRRMKAAGMTQARVNHQLVADNPASVALYAAMGFEDRFYYLEATKTVAAINEESHLTP